MCSSDLPKARMAILLAMRRREDPEIARFLSDVDPLIVLEAARAIHDVPIPAALPGLAKLAVASNVPLPLARLDSTPLSCLIRQDR